MVVSIFDRNQIREIGEATNGTGRKMEVAQFSFSDAITVLWMGSTD